jgi:hypothetical protein
VVAVLCTCHVVSRAEKKATKVLFHTLTTRLANFTFINNTIKGVNQGVAGEAADVFIGNSVPVRARASHFFACCFPVASRAFTHSSSQHTTISRCFAYEYEE